MTVRKDISLNTQWTRALSAFTLSCFAATLCAAAPPKASKRAAKATPVAVAAARKAIEERMAKEDQALERKDVDGAHAYETPDHESTDARGNVQYNERASQTRLLNRWSDIKTNFTILNFVLAHNQATIKLHHSFNARRIDDLQKEHTYMTEWDDEDVWIKGAKGWLEKSSRLIHQEITIDGVDYPGPR